MSESHGPTSLAAGSLLREYREWVGYSRDGIAERTGVSADQIERWEIVGVPAPRSKSFLELAEFLDIPGPALEAALAQGAACDSTVGPARYLPHDPIEVYEAAPLLEDAIVVHGWSLEEVAEALATLPTKVQAWRLGVIEMTRAERLTLSSLVSLRSE